MLFSGIGVGGQRLLTEAAPDQLGKLTKEQAFK